MLFAAHATKFRCEIARYADKVSKFCCDFACTFWTSMTGDYQTVLAALHMWIDESAYHLDGYRRLRWSPVQTKLTR